VMLSFRWWTEADGTNSDGIAEPSLRLVLLFIPSPGTDAIHVGPLQVRLYGVTIALGVLAAVWLAGRRWAARGGDPAMVVTIAAWAVPAGLLGARLYHVITDYRSYEGRWWDVVAIWHGGLGIPGGIIVGVATGVVVARRRHWPVAEWRRSEPASSAFPPRSTS
jgi:prolipoprotein diacylglyceryltransferase